MMMMRTRTETAAAAPPPSLHRRQYPMNQMASLLALLALGISSAAQVKPPPVPDLRSGALRIAFAPGGSYQLLVEGEEPVAGAPLSIFLDGAAHTLANGGLHCAPAWEQQPPGTDAYGPYKGVALRCTAGATATPAVFAWRAYPGRTAHDGKLLASLSLSAGANGTAAQGAFNIHAMSPAQFAPFPAWRVEGALNTSAFLCYGGDKAHLYSTHAFSGGGGGIAGNQQHGGTCFSLGNGPATLLWPASQLPVAAERSPVPTTQALVAGPASSFHLNYHRLIDGTAPAAQVAQAKLWYNAGREDVTLCMSTSCDTVQHNSGYVLLSEDEGTFNPGHVLPPGMPGGKGMTTKLYFSWSAENEDNWVTNSSAQPGPSYTNFGNADGAIYAAPGKGRIPLVTYANAAGTHHMAASKPSSKAWAKAHGYVPKGVLGYLDAPDPTEDLCTAHPGIDYVCCDLKQVNVSSPAECCAACKAQGTACSAWQTGLNGGTCYLKTGTLTNPVKVGPDSVTGYSQAPPAKRNASTSAPSVWGFGVSGDVLSVPAGFVQSTLLVHSGLGANNDFLEPFYTKSDHFTKTGSGQT